MTDLWAAYRHAATRQDVAALIAPEALLLADPPQHTGTLVALDDLGLLLRLHAHDPRAQTGAIEVLPAPDRSDDDDLDASSAAAVLARATDHLPLRLVELDVVRHERNWTDLGWLDGVAAHAGTLQDHRWWGGRWCSSDVLIAAPTDHLSIDRPVAQRSRPPSDAEPERNGWPDDCLAFEAAGALVRDIAIEPLHAEAFAQIAREIDGDPLLKEPFFAGGLAATQERLMSKFHAAHEPHAIHHHERDEVAGWVLAHALSPDLGSASIELGIFGAFRRQALAVPTVVKFAAYLFATYPLRTVRFVTSEDPSSPIWQRLADLMTLEVKRPGWVLSYGRYVDRWTFGLTRQRAFELATGLTASPTGGPLTARGIARLG